MLKRILDKLWSVAGYATLPEYPPETALKLWSFNELHTIRERCKLRRITRQYILKEFYENDFIYPSIQYKEVLVQP